MKRFIAKCLVLVSSFLSWSTTSIAVTDDFVANTAETMANLDTTVLHCSDKVMIDGKKFMQWQILWRTMLLSSDSAKFEKAHNTEIEKVVADYNQIATEEDADLKFCLASFLWFKENLGQSSPLTNFRKPGGEPLIK